MPPERDLAPLDPAPPPADSRTPTRVESRLSRARRRVLGHYLHSELNFPLFGLLGHDPDCLCITGCVQKCFGTFGRIYCPQTGPDCPQTGPRLAPRLPDWPSLAPDWPQTGPDCPQAGPDWPQTGPDPLQTGPRLALTSPRLTPDWLQTSPGPPDRGELAQEVG